MGMFDAIQNAVTGASEQLSEITGGQVLQDAQEQLGAATDGVQEAATSGAEQATTAVDDIVQSIGL